MAKDKKLLLLQLWCYTPKFPLEMTIEEFIVTKLKKLYSLKITRRFYID